MIEKKINIDSEKREIPIHIRLSFPIGILTSHFTDEGYNFVDWHWHEEVQYILVLKGRFHFHIADKTHEVKSDNGIFINAHQIHKAEALEADSAYMFIYFHPSLLTSDRESYLYKNYIAPILSDNFVGSITLEKDIKEDQALLETFQKIKGINDLQNEYFEMDILSALFELWKQTLICADKKSLVKAHHDTLTNDRLKKIITYIGDHYDRNLTLEEIASHIKLSRSESCRFFKAATGQSLFQYILNFRVNKSVELLLQTQMTIANIALAVGFNSQSYYTKCFTSIKSKTPSQIRKQYRNKELEASYKNSVGLE